MKKVFLIVSILLSIQLLFFQTGVTRGTVINIQSDMPIIGANLQLLDESNQGTDIEALFTLSQVPLGLNVIVVNLLGYETLTLTNIDVTRGKDVLLNISLRKSIIEIEEVMIFAASVKDKAQNEMAATIYTIQFSVEEINRYSDGRNEVAGHASKFAGVCAPDDCRNDIIIRGNSPTGVLWRIEGISNSSPNQFSILGTTGSPVSAVNSNVLKNSDFITSDFPADYGNANAGVFDLGFRNGNKERAEYSLQVGAFSGFEGMAEGKLGNKWEAI